MKNITDDYLETRKRLRINIKKIITIFFFVAFASAVTVFWWLKLVGITVTSEAFCGMDEHTHNADCYVTELICDIPEITEKIPEEPLDAPSEEEEEVLETPSDEADAEETYIETHTHSDECYQTILVCPLTEHTHTPECFPDKTADVETAEEWIRTMDDVRITNCVSENLVKIAGSQIGYEESTKNFESDGSEEKNGYTRYGEWFGNPYERWNALFVSFCLHYSNISNAADLQSASAENMRLAWQAQNVYSEAGSYAPQRGDVVFWDTDNDCTSDKVGILVGSDGTNHTVICGDSHNTVETITLSVYDNIIGYGLTGSLQYATDLEPEPENIEPESTDLENSADTSADTKPVTLMMTKNTGENITYTSNLSTAVTNVTIKTQDGKEITVGSTLYVGQTYQISMQFSETNTGTEWVQFKHTDEHYLYYQIPASIQYEPFIDWHPLTAENENGTIEQVGEYFIDEKGLLKIVFFEDDEGICFEDKYSNVSFSINFDATLSSTQAGNDTTIDFGNDITVDLVVDGGAGVTTTKTHGSYDSENHTVDYTIEVKATHGVVKDLIIDDKIWENHSVLRDSIVVTDLEGNILDPQPYVTDSSANIDGATGGFQLSGFPDLVAGKGFLITYDSKINDDQLSKESVSLWNSVDTFGEDSNGNPVYHYNEDWLNVELENITKDGKQTVIQDANGNQIHVIEWKVVIKKNQSDLQGTVIIDTLGDGLSYYKDKEIVIKHYDQWGNPLSDTSLSWNNVTIKENSMEFSLPEGYSYEIIYYTTYETLGADEHKTYNNSISATINGKEETSTGQAEVVGFVPRVQKSASGTDGEYVYFTIESDIPSVIKDWGNFYLTDMAAFWGYPNDAGYLYVENSPLDMTVTATTENGETATFTPYAAGGPTENTYILVAPAGGTMHHSFNIYFNTSEAAFESSKWILEEDATLTITYKLPFTAKTGTEWEGALSNDKTLGEVLMEGHTLANEAYLNYTDGIKTTGVANYNYAPKIIKDSFVNENGCIDYTVVFNNSIPGTYNNGSYLNATTTSAYFTDTFDEKLEYVDGTLTVTCYNPWNEGQWLNKYTYRGSVEGNSMNVHANQFVLTETNRESGMNGVGACETLEAYYQWMSGGGKYVFTYTLKVKDPYLYSTEHSKYSFINTAEIKWDTDGSSEPASKTTEFETGLIDKQAVQENNKINFAIHINSNALDILEGMDTLSIEDTMTQNLSVYWNTIKLFYEDQNGNWIDFDDENSLYDYTVTFDQTTNKLTFVVPDSLHIRIDYTTLITETGLVSVNNTVSINARVQASDLVDATFTVQSHSGGASGSLENITLLKQDGETGQRLPNVTFLLYGPVGDEKATVPDNAAKYILTDTDQKLNYIGSYTTGSDGSVVIESKYLTRGGPYALVEVSPPDGYVPLEKPVFFYFYESDPNNMVQSVTTLISVENYTYGFVLPETGTGGILLLTLIGFALMTLPILYINIRRDRKGG